MDKSEKAMLKIRLDPAVCLCAYMQAARDCIGLNHNTRGFHSLVKTKANFGKIKFAF